MRVRENVAQTENVAPASGSNHVRGDAGDDLLIRSRLRAAVAGTIQLDERTKAQPRAHSTRLIGRDRPISWYLEEIYSPTPLRGQISASSLVIYYNFRDVKKFQAQSETR